MDKSLAATNTAVLAYIGDAVYEVYVRKYVFLKGILKPDKLNSAAIQYVRAEAQSLALDSITADLSETEISIVRRGKNHKITSMPKKVDPMVYKRATGFESLIGYLELSGEKERLELLINKAFQAIEQADMKIKR